DARQRALAAGALGGGISGSGPSIFMLNKDKATAHAAAEAMGHVYQKMGIEYHLHVGPIASAGARVVATT
ncbi:MAG: homoserine kinase, partial [Hymenobacter sp.]